jgi:peroxiredoxin
MPALSAGAMAPDFTLPTLDGNQFSLARALERGPVVLAFFKITCPVCQYAFPFIERLHQSFLGSNATIIGISQHGQKDAGLFCKEFGVTFPVALDDPSDYAVSNAYGLTNVPTVFLIAPDGVIKVSSVGWSRADLSGIHGWLADSLQAAPPPLFRAGEQVMEFKAG